MKRLFVVMMAVLLVAGYSSAVMAFHDAGVAYCGGCHTMHNSQGGALVDTDHPTGNAYLLKKGSPSDTCLSCHASYGQLTTDGLSLGPGGDFYWTKTDVSYVGGGGSTTTIFAREHGHNLTAPGNGLVADSVLTTAPGGTYTSAQLGCNSCHDPHGNTNFRLLYGIESDTAANYPGDYAFTEAAPVATGNSRRTKIADAGAEKHAQHTAYVSGMSDWCANCHADFHSGMTSNIVHPSDQNLGSDIAGNYNAYVTTEVLTGDVSTSYLGLVPFEDAANATTSTTGPTATSKVMCLTCHRAHASPYPDAGRWDIKATELSASHPAGEPYLAEWDGGNPLDLTHQRSLCNKCHIQD